MKVWFGLVMKNVPSSMRPPTRPSNGPIFAVNNKNEQDVSIWGFKSVQTVRISVF